jgi:uncharacterized membrane protein
LFFEVIGIFVIFIGTCRTWYESGSGMFSLTCNIKQYIIFRVELGNAIIAGLEMFIPADVISTMLKTNFMELGIILFLVVIRAALSFFLSQELHMIRSQEKNDEFLTKPLNFQHTIK